MNRTIKNGFTTVFVSLLLGISSCQTVRVINIAQDDNLDRVIESEFKRLQMPGLAYAAIKEDSIIYSGAKGYANIKEKKDFTPQTRMMIASISKTVVVTAIMQLYDKGLIFLDEDINNYLPFKVRNPNFPDNEITVKMLLTHTSSIAEDNYSEQVFYLHGYVDYPESLMSFVRNFLTENGQYYTKKNFSENRPGSYHSYSNIGACLLACLVEQVGGTDFNTYCKSNIFQPLGMTRTTWFFSETPKSEIAIPYTYSNDADPSNPFYTFPTYPDGHLITTIDDLSKFLRAYIMRGTFNHFQLLKPETVDLIVQGYVKGEGSMLQQGLIFLESKIGNFYVWGHQGGDYGISTQMYFDPVGKIGFIMFNNRMLGYSETIGNALLLYAQQN